MDYTIWKTPEDDSFKLNSITHIWLLPLELTQKKRLYLKKLLSSDEVKRADRFHFEKDSNFFIAARGQLRTLLGRYLNMPPEEIQFNYNAYGKPYIINSNLNFNLSHSHKLALAAFNKKYELGIDIEWIRRDLSDLKIAKRFFSQEEVKQLFSLPKEYQKEAFFNCWTRKESYIKARGKGLSIPLNQFDVEFTPDKSARLIATRDDPTAAENWVIHALFPVPDYTAAITIDQSAKNIKCWNGKKLVIQ